VKPGTILGDKNGFWFKTGSDGIVYIRKDVLEANIQTVIVDYDEPYHVSSGKPVRSIGTMSSQVGVYEHPILFVQVDDPALRDLGQKEKTQVASSQGVRSSADEAPRSHHSSSKREVVDEGYGGSMKFGRKLEDDKRRLVEDEPVVNQKKPSPDQSSVGLAFGYGSDPAGSIRAPEAPMKPAEKEAKAEAKIATALPSATAKPENSQPPAPTLGSKALFS
jgi:hypothetical protein